MPIGRLTKKIQCQLIACVMSPPATSPIAPPPAATTLKTAIAFDRSRGMGKSVTIMPSATAEVNEPPTPCTKRAAINITGVVDSPQTSEAVVNTVSPAMKTRRRPTRSPRRPARSSRPPKPIR